MGQGKSAGMGKLVSRVHWGTGWSTKRASCATLDGSPTTDFAPTVLAASSVAIMFANLVPKGGVRPIMDKSVKCAQRAVTRPTGLVVTRVVGHWCPI